MLTGTKSVGCLGYSFRADANTLTSSVHILIIASTLSNFLMQGFLLTPVDPSPNSHIIPTFQAIAPASHHPSSPDSPNPSTALYVTPSLLPPEHFHFIPAPVTTLPYYPLFQVLSFPLSVFLLHFFLALGATSGYLLTYSGVVMQSTNDRAHTSLLF